MDEVDERLGGIVTLSMPPKLAGTRGGRGGETEGPSSLQIGDMLLEPETDMLGEVAGELVMN